jgi:hypothetical protein
MEWTAAVRDLVQSHRVVRDSIAEYLQVVEQTTSRGLGLWGGEEAKPGLAQILTLCSEQRSRLGIDVVGPESPARPEDIAAIAQQHAALRHDLAGMIQEIHSTASYAHYMIPDMDHGVSDVLFTITDVSEAFATLIGCSLGADLLGY